MVDSQRAAILHLANAVLSLADALGCVKKNAISQSQCRLAESFEANLHQANDAVLVVQANLKILDVLSPDEIVGAYADLLGMSADIFTEGDYKPQ